MKLNVKERLILVGILPEKGDFKTMSSVKSIKDKLYLTGEELKKFDVRTTEESTVWNSKGNEQIEIDLQDSEKSFLYDTLEDLNKSKELTLELFILLDRFRKEN